MFDPVRSFSPSVRRAGLALSVCAGLLDAQRPTARPTPGPAAGTLAGNVITVTAHDYFYVAPNPLPSGVTTIRLRNMGPDLHHLWIVKLDEGYAYSDFSDALRSGRVSQPWAKGLGGPETPEVGGEAIVTLDLAPGRYVMACMLPSTDGASHMSKGMFMPLTVTAAKTPSRPLPNMGAAIVLSNTGARASEGLVAGLRTIRVASNADSLTGVRIGLLMPGKTLADVESWIATGGKDRTAPPVRLVGGVAALAKGEENFVVLALQRGQYALMPMEFAGISNDFTYARGKASLLTVK
ncbi:MAG: hypothetical protein MUF00_14365 [Gemmatimonadaceae bacterium]|jgi:hypothetical protein|nr:hypothetical protein [Gemmatimonadaceae bacterium]